MQAVDDAELPDDPDFRATMRAYIEWATKDVVSYLAPESVVPPDRPMPRWSWDGLE
jgi:hemoglobin